jgi:hypothetical protein
MKPPLGRVRIAYDVDGMPIIWREEPEVVPWRSARPEDNLSASAEPAEAEMPRGWPRGWPKPEKVVRYTAPRRARELDYPAYGGKATGPALPAYEVAHEEVEIKALIASAGAGPKPIISHSRDGDALTTHVDWPATEEHPDDPALARLVTLARIPVDREIDDLEAGEADPAVEEALVAAAARVERRERRELLQRRRAEAEAMFAAAEAEALKRASARRHREVMTRYLTARLAAARRHRVAKAAQR